MGVFGSSNCRKQQIICKESQVIGRDIFGIKVQSDAGNCQGSLWPSLINTKMVLDCIL
jgi:hypothetical protein